jgi:LPXTG-motif cell wall-anchored protein
MLVAVAAPILAVVVASAGPVHAAPYPPPTPSVAVDTTTTTAGGTVTVTFCGFDAGETVTIALGGASLGSGTAGSDGCGSAAVTMPAGISGTQVLTLTGALSLRVATVEVAVVGSGSDSSLPNTGAAVKPFGVVAGALIMAGLVFVGASRARRRRTD